MTGDATLDIVSSERVDWIVWAKAVGIVDGDLSAPQ